MGWERLATSSPTMSDQLVTILPSAIYLRWNIFPKRIGTERETDFMTITDSIMTGDTKNVESFREHLLKWYDKHKRALPWRALTGQTPTPYHVWLSEIMLQQTTVPAVIPYFVKFLTLWPSVERLAAADSDNVMQNWAGLGYYARARNLHKCAKIISNDHKGIFPSNIDDLKKLPGIGDYTAAAITAIAFGKPANVVDGNVERVMSRIFNVLSPVPDSKPVLKKLAGHMASGETRRAGDYAQALMDLGATICTPTSPKCATCPVKSFCDALAAGHPEKLPIRKAKKDKPQKHGYVYWITNHRGDILFERRGDKGMLGGTIGLPTSEWVNNDTKMPHLSIKLTPIKTKIKVLHSFTHFDLKLEGITANLGEENPPFDKDYFWVRIEEAKKLGLPTLFKKAFVQFV